MTSEPFISPAAALSPAPQPLAGEEELDVAIAAVIEAIWGGSLDVHNRQSAARAVGYLQHYAGWQRPSHAREQAERIEKLEAALTRIDDWARAYPEEAFPGPDLTICKTALKSAGQSIDGLHASWARHILNGVGGITRAVLTDGGRDNG